MLRVAATPAAASSCSKCDRVILAGGCQPAFAREAAHEEDNDRRTDAGDGFRSVIDTVLSAADEFPARFERAGGGVLTLKAVIAQRKVFLSKRTLEYRCRLRVDDEARQVTLFEMLSEKGMGVSGADVDMPPGFGFRKEKYKTGAATRSGSIEEQSPLFAKDYAYGLRYERVREAV